MGDESYSGVMVSDIPTHSVPPPHTAAEILQVIEQAMGDRGDSGLAQEDAVEMIALGRQKRDDREW